MRRLPHWLKGNKSCRSVHSAIWVDTETDPEPGPEGEVRHRLRFGWACFQRTKRSGEWCAPEWFRFESAEDFWAWAESRMRPDTKTYMFAHNWGFDAAVLGTFLKLPSRGWKMGHCVIECPPVIVSWRREGRSFVMLDTLNWWRVPLRVLGESIGVRKLDMPDEHASREVWDTYARQDVEVIRQACLNWWDFLVTYDLGGFAHTLAGQAFRAFRHRFMEHNILIDDHPKALALARASLFGGRVEAFRLGRIEGPVLHYDVNSMYPYVMRDREYPTVLRLVCRDPTPEELSKWSLSQALVAECLLETDEPRYPKRMQGRLCFPTGQFVTALTTPDLLQAMERGHLLRVFACAVYDRAPIFSGFVRDLYSLRLSARSAHNDVQSYLLKILMNSLYGKFGQHGGVWERVGDAAPDKVEAWREIDYHTREVFSMRAFGGVLQQLRKEPEAQQSHPAIAAHVTAYARELLWSLVLAAGRENVIYCDTDSLFCLGPGAERLDGYLDESQLGQLKHEGTYPFLHVFGAKDYATPAKRVCKGVRGKATWIDDHTIRHEEWSTLGGLIRRGDLSAPVTRPRTKVLHRDYLKGDVQPDGSVLPLRLSLPEARLELRE